MNMSIWAIRRPVPVIALFLALVLLGLAGFFRLPVTQFPNIDVPVITVEVVQPAAGPSEVATQIVEPLESAVADIVGVRHVTSTALEGVARLIIEFELETDTDRALNDVKDAVTGARAELPADTLEPTVERLDVTGAPILIYAVQDQTRSIPKLSTLVDDVIVRQVSIAEGVGRVERIGGGERIIEVDLDLGRLTAFGLTVAQISDQLRQSNIDLGAGSGNLSGQEFAIRSLGAADTIEALGERRIQLPQGGTVRLDDLGKIREGADDEDNFALVDGQPVVGFAIYRATGKSDLLAAESAMQKIAAFKATYPELTFTLVDDATTFTKGNYESAMNTLYEGAALAVIVVMLFLRDWRATIITALALPLSILPTFIVMDLLGFSLNTVSLLGITLVTGILVDDAIVEIENIVRHIQMGKPPYEATEEAASEIGMTVIAISFTIVAVFAPVSFMSGIAGQYFRQFGLTVAVAVLFSLLVARLITPLVAAYFMRPKPAHQEQDGPLMRSYMRLLKWTLHNRSVTLLIGLAVFAVSIFSATLLPTEFIPEIDSGRAQVSLELPPGSLMADTRSAAREITKRVSGIPEVATVFVNGSPQEATITIDYGSKTTRDRNSVEIEHEIEARLADIPDVRIHLVKPDGTRDVQISVLGDDADAVNGAAENLAKAMNDLPTVRGATSEASLLRPEIRVTPDPELAAQLGVTASSLATTIRVATIGDTAERAPKFNAGDRQIPIFVRLERDLREDLIRMSGIRVPTNTGTPIPLSAVANVSISSGPVLVERYDQQYRTTIAADLEGGALLGEATKDVAQLVSGITMPEGTRVQSSGDAETMGEVFSQFGLAMGAGLLFVYVVLVLLFSSFLTPLTILASLPLAVGGAIFALYIYGAGIGLSVVIGFLMLMGIVTKNAIMLVEFALEAMARGIPKMEAMLDAAHKRARPILMTTIAMTAGMVPSALAIGEGGEFRAPMAVAVIGGLLLSTLLSLVFVPSLFSVVQGLRARLLKFITQSTNRPATEPNASP